MIRKIKNTPEKFWSLVYKSGECWLWKGKLNLKGYGIFSYQSKMRNAHRTAYLITHGSIADGLHIDHLCRQLSCVNPAHLEAVTNAENRRRGLMGILKEECPKSHPWIEPNLFKRSDGSQSCQTCRYNHHKNYYSKNKDSINTRRRPLRRKS